MSEALPSRVDAIRLAGRDARITNVTPVSAMTRLTEMLADDAGLVESELAFAHDAGDHCVVEGRASATLDLMCQRCLGVLLVQVDAKLRVAVVADEAAAERLPDGMEPVLSTDGEVSPLALVEDELILALPIVALHENCTAPVEAAPDVGAEHSNPFAALKELKNRQR